MENFSLTSSLIRDLSLALEPADLMTELGMTPDAWQRALLSASPHRALLCCGRQTGKSTTSAVLSLHEALYHAPALVLLLSPSLRQSSELFRKVAGFFHELPEAGAVVNESTLRLELGNGSRIISLPASEPTIRGYSACNLLVIDEASRVPDELIAAIKPALATVNGRLIALSTPYGQRGYFYREWEHGGDSWHRVMLKSANCGRITTEFLEEERRELGEFLYLQEYECAFLDSDTSVFSSVLIQQALSDEVEPLWTA